MHMSVNAADSLDANECVNNLVNQHFSMSGKPSTTALTGTLGIKVSDILVLNSHHREDTQP